MTTMADSFEKQRSLAMKRQEAARKAEGQRRVQQYLDALPDPEAPSRYPAPLLSPDPRSGDNQGDLPRELQKGAPPPLGTDPVYDAAELAHPQRQNKIPPQAAISLNEA
jgi:hypothetical protein